MSLLVEEKQEIDFKDGSHLLFPIRMILAIFDLQATRCSLQRNVNWPLDSGEEVKNRFSRWLPRQGGHLGLPFRTILAIFDLCFLPSSKSIGLSVQEKKQKNRFSRRPPWGSCGISDQNDF